MGHILFPVRKERPAASTKNRLLGRKDQTNADLIVEYLRQMDVQVIFAVPGGAIEPLFNALARSAREGGPRLVVARHECGAAFMADGYYRETGNMGVVCATTGPGATNLLTGIASAYADEIPILVLTAQTPLPKFGKRALQESSCTAIDTVGMFRYCTVYNSLVSHQDQLEGKLISAIMAMHREPHAPAHLSIPSDILRGEAEIKPHIHSDLFTHDFYLSDQHAIAKLEEKLAKVDTLGVYLGDGIGKARDEIMRFIELTGASFVTGPTGKAWIDEGHRQYFGVYGFAGHQSAKELFQAEKIDLIIAIGADLGELGTSGWKDELLNSKLVHIDASAEHFTRSSMANLHVCGNLKAIFSQLLENIERLIKSGKKWQTIEGQQYRNLLNSYSSLDEPHKCQVGPHDISPVKPQRLMTVLSEKLPSDARVFVDAGNAWSWATHYYITGNSQGYYRLAMAYGSMAWAVSACIGSAVASPDSPMVCIVGDGSYLMSAQEITVAAQEHLPIVYIILNDSALGMVKHGQQLGGQESIGWQLNKVDYAAMAKSVGVESFIVRSHAELDAIDFQSLFSKANPTLIDVRIDANEVPPMGERVISLVSVLPGG